MEHIDVLKEDYDGTLAFIDKCDQHMFAIKNWALVTTSAVIAFAISQHQHAIVWVNLLLVPAFAYLEVIYKTFQDTAVEHSTDISQRIDRYLAGDTSELLAGYKHGFGRRLQYPSYGQVRKVWSNPNRFHIRNFYGVVALFSVGAFYVGWYFFSQ
jgi:hypothetical protein